MLDRWTWWRIRWRIEVLALVLPDLSRQVSFARLLGWTTPTRPAEWCADVSVDELCSMVERRLAHPVRMRGRRCLRKSLMLFYLLRLSGRPAEIHFGIFNARRNCTKGHCWVTLDGKLLTEPAEEPITEVLCHGTTTSQAA